MIAVNYVILASFCCGGIEKSPAHYKYVTQVCCLKTKEWFWFTLALLSMF